MENDRYLESQGRRLLFIIDNIYMRSMYKIPRAGTLGVVGSQMSYVPGPVGLFFRRSRLLPRPEINQIIRPVMKIFADHEGPFPRR
jgi:hypothetical protein